MQPAIAGCFFTGKFGQTPSRTENSQSVSQEKRIADLATDIKKSGLTTRKATIAAQTLYQTAQQYGPNAEAMLAAYEPGQDPKRFASGFQNAYILGTQGNQEALGRSKAAAYLTQEQRLTAYGLGKTIYSDRISSEETPENTFAKIALHRRMYKTTSRIQCPNCGERRFELDYRYYDRFPTYYKPGVEVLLKTAFRIADNIKDDKYGPR